MKRILLICLLFIAANSFGQGSITSKCAVCPPTLNGVPDGYVLTDSSGRAKWKAPSATNALVVKNGLTKTGDTLLLGGALDRNTTIKIDGFDYKVQDSIEGIYAGIYESVLTGNKCWQAEHFNGGFGFTIINKAEVFPVGVNDYDGAISVAKEDSSNQTAAVGVVKRVGTNDLYQIIAWTDTSGTDGYYGLLGKNGFEMYGTGNTKILQVYNKTIFAVLPEYANDAAADADATLPSGGFYKVVANRAIFQKP